ncbi:MAG: glycosyltransferase family 4 protein [Acidimicrobiales bacterium]
MKIAEVSPYSLSVPGGVQGQVIALSHALSNLGHEVEIIAPYDEPVSAEELRSLGASHTWRANGSVAPIAIGPVMWRRMYRLLVGGTYDVVHVHEPFVPLVGVAAMLRSRAVTIGTFHRAGVSPIYRAYGRAFRPLTRRLDASVAVSAEAASTAHEVWGLSPTVVGNAVDLSRFADARPWSHEGDVVMFIGRHEHRKGLSTLLSAWRRIERLDTELWIAGDGPQTEELHHRFRGLDGVKWLGRISEAEASSRLRAADVVVAPSLYGESFGVVLLEAMAADAVVVASAIPGYQTVAQHERDALLVPPGDDRSLADAIVRSLDDHTLASALRSGGRITAQGYSVDELAKSYADLFLDCLSSRSK